MAGGRGPITAATPVSLPRGNHDHRHMLRVPLWVKDTQVCLDEGRYIEITFLLWRQIECRLSKVQVLSVIVWSGAVFNHRAPLFELLWRRSPSVSAKRSHQTVPCAAQRSSVCFRVMSVSGVWTHRWSASVNNLKVWYILLYLPLQHLLHEGTIVVWQKVVLVFDRAEGNETLLNDDLSKKKFLVSNSYFLIVFA